MSKTIALTVVAVVLANILVAVRPAQAADTTSTQRAELFVRQLSAGDYASAASTFDSTMKAAMSVTGLEETWKSIEQSAGKFVMIEGSHVTSQGDYEIVIVTTIFDKMRLDIKLVYNTTNQLAGLWFAPSAPKLGYDRPPYVDSTRFHEIEVKIGSGDFALPGTISMPNGSGPFPALVLVHGSGPNDRDETVGPNKPFRDIAWGLASRGIAVLRYEKRTRAFPQQFVNSTDKLTVKEETIDDAVAGFQLLRQTGGVDSSRVFILGHSLGGMLMPRIALLTPDAHGYIILAGAARPLGELILEQMVYIASLDSSISKATQAQLDSLKVQVALTESPDLTAQTPASSLPLSVPAAYWLDLRGYKPAEVATKIPQPILILQGARDYQVTIKDFDLWKKALDARKNVSFKLYPDLNHLFITGSGMAQPSDYDQAGHVAEPVIADISAFIGQ